MTSGRPLPRNTIKKGTRYAGQHRNYPIREAKITCSGEPVRIFLSPPIQQKDNKNVPPKCFLNFVSFLTFLCDIETRFRIRRRSTQLSASSLLFRTIRSQYSYRVGLSYFHPRKDGISHHGWNDRYYASSYVRGEYQNITLDPPPLTSIL